MPVIFLLFYDTNNFKLYFIDKKVHQAIQEIIQGASEKGNSEGHEGKGAFDAYERGI